LLRWVIGVEDREEQTWISPKGWNVLGGWSRQVLDQVRLRLRADDDHESIRKPLGQATYGMQRRENVRCPRLVEDRHCTFLSSGGQSFHLVPTGGY
jgi:hypothetical protein